MKRYSIFFVGILFVFQSCSDNIKEEKELKQFFDKYRVNGSFALYDNGRGEIKLYNLERDTTRMSPASTFKIVTALVALQTGVALNDSTVINWDGVTRDAEDWNRDMSLAEAFKISAVPHFQELARRIGRDTLQKWLDTLHYGNMTMGSRVDTFWLDNSLLVSPDEQLGLVKRLYFDQLPFTKGAQHTVRNLMLREDNTNYSLSYKTGWGLKSENKHIGWVVGWIEENRHPYFFVLNIESPDENPEVSVKIVKDILAHYGFFDGKM
ncbi:MAG: class D beta-lactamase [Chitinophagaceae bacterium]|nr:class D beta-lactamase [Chitinophagaceae bacterium]MCW5929180.1 class D beta-lactamase [Chitinophagaceae bacterium]